MQVRSENERRNIIMKASPYLIVALAPLCWAGNVVLARGVIDIVPPIGLAFWRWTMAFFILLPFTRYQAGLDWPVVKQHWKIMALLSLFGISSFNTLLYIAVHTITAINGALIQTTMPAFIIVISWLLYRERISRKQGLGVFLCMVGAALVVLRGDILALGGLTFVAGDGWLIAACLLYSLYTALLRKRPAIHPLSFVTYTFGVGALALLPLYLWEWTQYGPIQVTWQVVATVFYVAVFPSIVAYLCWNRGAQAIGPNRTGLFITLVPIFASIMAVILLGETLKAYHLTGMFLIFSGMILFNQQQKT